MKITKRQLKRIIREEYSRLKTRGLVSEIRDMSHIKTDTGWGSDNYSSEYEDTDFSTPSNKLDVYDAMDIANDLVNTYNNHGINAMKTQLDTADYRGSHLEQVVDSLFEKFEQLEDMGKIAPADANQIYDQLEGIY